MILSVVANLPQRTTRLTTHLKVTSIMGRRHRSASRSDGGLSSLFSSSDESDTKEKKSKKSKKEKASKKEKKHKRDKHKHDKVKPLASVEDSLLPAEAVVSGACQGTATPVAPDDLYPTAATAPTANNESGIQSAEVLPEGAAAVEESTPTIVIPRREVIDEDEDEDEDFFQNQSHPPPEGDTDFLESLIAFGQGISVEPPKPVAVVAAAPLARPPAVESNALIMYDASEEAQDAVERTMSRKAPKPSKDEQKKLLQLPPVPNHAEMDYPHFEKSFYTPPEEIQLMTEEEIGDLLRDLDGAKVKGRNPPRPMKTWDGTGFSDKIRALLKASGMPTPFAVQSIGVPALMSGRDLLTVAKTGSGKTLMYVLPMLRQVEHQRRCQGGEGPIGLVLVPTMELAKQVSDVIKPFAEAMGLRLTQAFAGVNIDDNVKALLRGCELMVATPGRLVDLLAMRKGRICNLSKVTFAVIDEIDRMYAEAFNAHLMAFLDRIRPDRQLAFIAATLPYEFNHIRKYLNDPVEVRLGKGSCTPATNVKQEFVFFPLETYNKDAIGAQPDKRLHELLRLLAELRQEGGDSRLALVFVDDSRRCEELERNLAVYGYDGRVGTLHGKLDPEDRVAALELFQPGQRPILIATDLGERGLDIAHLDLVVNYHMPKYCEGYVQRIGRTGRAGREGRAVSFFTIGDGDNAGDDLIAPDLVWALQAGGQQVPKELEERALVAKGKGYTHKLCFRRGYQKRDRVMARRKDSDSDSSSGSDDDQWDDPPIVETTAADAEKPNSDKPTSTALIVSDRSIDWETRIQNARNVITMANEVLSDTTGTKRFTCEYVFNDEPEVVRDAMSRATRAIGEETGCTIVRKGYHLTRRDRKTQRLEEDVRPLYFHIIGWTQEAVQNAKQKITIAKAEAQQKVQQGISRVRLS